MLKKFVPALAALVAAAPALAADLPSYKSAPVPPPVMVAYDWTGVYIGADLGGVWAQGQYSNAYSTNIYSNSVMGGGFVGAQKQFGTFVLGLEGDVQGLGVSKNWGNLGVQQNLLASINGRAGVAFDRVLVYAIGGVAFTDTNFYDGLRTKYSNNNVGWDVGGGVEYAFLPNWTVRAEYRYYQFGPLNKTIPGTNSTFKYQTNDNTFRVGVAYKFPLSAPVPVVAKY